MPAGIERAFPLSVMSTFPAAPSSSQIRRARSVTCSPLWITRSIRTGPSADPACAATGQSSRVAAIRTLAAFGAYEA